MIQFLEPTPVLVLYAALVAGLLVAELKENRSAQRMLKPAAAIGFIFIAISVGAAEHRYGHIILFGLVACALGDVFLLSRNSAKLFIAGMAAFALGHLAYLYTFAAFGAETGALALIVTAALVTVMGVGVYTWLQPHLPKDMRLAVPVYFIIILIMLINALNLPLELPLILAMAGAILFTISDIFVARDRFVSPDPRNAFAITPLYFGAQALIALSTHASF